MNKITYRYHFMRYGEYRHQDFASLDEVVEEAAIDIASGSALALSVERRTDGKWAGLLDEDELNRRAWEIVHAHPGM